MMPRRAFAACQYDLDWITSGEDVQYRIVEDAEEIVLAFQASNSNKDWWHNLACLPYKWMENNWYAHRGFVCAYKSVRDEIIAKVDYLLAQKLRPVTVCGWSHGAALATLAYEDITWRHPTYDVTGHVFGTPRVLWGPCEIDARFRRFHRWNVRGDPVSMLPPWLMGYHHVGVKHQLGPLSFINGKSHTAESISRYLPC
jgi:hypothetical protein